jgi:uncharacterized membrane protein HdeD (DUF308 family)
LDSHQGRRIKTVEELTAEEEERLGPLRIQNEASPLTIWANIVGQSLFLCALGVIVMIYGALSGIDAMVYLGLFCVLSGVLMFLFTRRKYRAAIEAFRENVLRRR